MSHDVRSSLAALGVGVASLIVLPGWRDPVVVGLAVAGAVAAWFAGRSMLPLLGAGLAGIGLAGVWPAAFLSSYLVASQRAPRAAAAWATLITVVAGGRALLPAPPPVLTGPSDLALLLLTAVAAPFLLGWWVRQRRGERAAVVARARSQERTRIAREMHDVVAHKVSLMVLHAGAIEVGTAEAGTGTRAGLVQDLGRQAMANLREVLAVLRDGGGPPGSGPTPGLAGLDGLIADSRRAGLRVDRHETGIPAAVSDGAGAAVYRVVQEALTNVHRHAAVDRAEVRLAWSADAVEVTVRNPGRAGRARGRSFPSGSGLGLVGLRERVTALGGTFDAGPSDDGFEVRALLPSGPREDGRRHP